MEEQANKQIGLSFGALSDRIGEQLRKQGFKFNEKKIASFENELNAIQTLRFGISGLLTDSMVDKIVAKLYKKIVAHVANENKLKVLK